MGVWFSEFFISIVTILTNQRAIVNVELSVRLHYKTSWIWCITQNAAYSYMYVLTSSSVSVSADTKSISMCLFICDNQLSMSLEHVNFTVPQQLMVLVHVSNLLLPLYPKQICHKKSMDNMCTTQNSRVFPKYYYNQEQHSFLLLLFKSSAWVCKCVMCSVCACVRFVCASVMHACVKWHISTLSLVN